MASAPPGAGEQVPPGGSGMVQPSGGAATGQHQMPWMGMPGGFNPAMMQANFMSVFQQQQSQAAAGGAPGTAPPQMYFNMLGMQPNMQQPGLQPPGMQPAAAVAPIQMQGMSGMAPQMPGGQQQVAAGMPAQFQVPMQPYNMAQQAPPAQVMPSNDLGQSFQQCTQSLSGAEKEYYSFLWNAAGCSDSQQLKGQAAVQFLSKSGLDRLTLRRIWELADYKNCQHLTWQEFVVALKLISAAQKNQPVSLERVFESCSPNSMDCPRFDGVDGADAFVRRAAQAQEASDTARAGASRAVDNWDALNDLQPAGSPQPPNLTAAPLPSQAAAPAAAHGCVAGAPSGGACGGGCASNAGPCGVGGGIVGAEAVASVPMLSVPAASAVSGTGFSAPGPSAAIPPAIPGLPNPAPAAASFEAIPQPHGKEEPSPVEEKPFQLISPPPPAGAALTSLDPSEPAAPSAPAPVAADSDSWADFGDFDAAPPAPTAAEADGAGSQPPAAPTGNLAASAPSTGQGLWSKMSAFDDLLREDDVLGGAIAKNELEEAFAAEAANSTTGASLADAPGSTLETTAAAEDIDFGDFSASPVPNEASTGELLTEAGASSGGAAGASSKDWCDFAQADGRTADQDKAPAAVSTSGPSMDADFDFDFPPAPIAPATGGVAADAAAASALAEAGGKEVSRLSPAAAPDETEDVQWTAFGSADVPGSPGLPAAASAPGPANGEKAAVEGARDNDPWGGFGSASNVEDSAVSKPTGGIGTGFLASSLAFTGGETSLAAAAPSSTPAAAAPVPAAAAGDAAAWAAFDFDDELPASTAGSEVTALGPPALAFDVFDGGSGAAAGAVLGEPSVGNLAAPAAAGAVAAPVPASAAPTSSAWEFSFDDDDEQPPTSGAPGGPTAKEAAVEKPGMLADTGFGADFGAWGSAPPPAPAGRGDQAAAKDEFVADFGDWDSAPAALAAPKPKFPAALQEAVASPAPGALSPPLARATPSSPSGSSPLAWAEEPKEEPAKPLPPCSEEFRELALGLARLGLLEEAHRCLSHGQVNHALSDATERKKAAILDDDLEGAIRIKTEMQELVAKCVTNEEISSWRQAVSSGKRNRELDAATERLQQRCQYLDDTSRSALNVAVGNLKHACPPRENLVDVAKIPSLIAQQRRATQMAKAIEAASSANTMRFLQILVVCLGAVGDILRECLEPLQSLASNDWSQEERDLIVEADDFKSHLHGLEVLRRLKWRFGFSVQTFLPRSGCVLEGRSGADGGLTALHAKAASCAGEASRVWAKVEAELNHLRLSLAGWDPDECLESGAEASPKDRQQAKPLCVLCLLPCAPLGLNTAEAKAAGGAAAALWRGGIWHVQCANFWKRHGAASRLLSELGVPDPFADPS